MLLEMSNVCLYGNKPPIIGNGELTALATNSAPSIDFLSLDRCYFGGNRYLYQLSVETSTETTMGIVVTIADEPVLYPSIASWDFWVCNPDHCELTNGEL
jgi:hypothetical protein